MTIFSYFISANISNCLSFFVQTVGRQELLTFLAGYAEEFHAPVDCSELPGPLVLAMQDKTAGVRSLAEALLGVLNARGLISRLALDKATRDLAPAAKRTLMPSIEKMVSSWGARRSGGVSQEEEYHAEPSITLRTHTILFFVY